MTLQQSSVKEDCAHDEREVLPPSIQICPWIHLDLSANSLAASWCW